MDWGRAYRVEWLTFTWGRTFILAPDAPLPKGALGKQGCHLLTGRRIIKPPKHTVISSHCKQYIIQCVCFSRPAAILAHKQQVFTVQQQVLVFIIAYMFANKWKPRLLWCIYGNVPEEILKGHKISMNNILEVISMSGSGHKSCCRRSWYMFYLTTNVSDRTLWPRFKYYMIEHYT